MNNILKLEEISNYSFIYFFNDSFIQLQNTISPSWPKSDMSFFFVLMISDKMALIAQSWSLTHYKRDG